MSAAHVAALVLLWAGVVVTVLSCLGAVRPRRVYVRLHYVAPATSIGAPLTGLALAITNGWSLTTAEDIFIVFLLAITGPVLASSAARVAAQREGLIQEDSPQ